MGAIPNLSRWKPPPKNYLNPRRPPSLNLSLQPFFNPPHSFFQPSAFGPFLPTFDLRPSTSSPTSHLQLLPFFKHHLTLRLAICDHFCKPLQNFSFLTCKQLSNPHIMAMARARKNRQKRREEQQTQGTTDHDSTMDFDQEVSPSVIQHWYASFFSPTLPNHASESETLCRAAITCAHEQNSDTAQTSSLGWGRHARTGLTRTPPHRAPALHIAWSVVVAFLACRLFDWKRGVARRLDANTCGRRD